MSANLKLAIVFFCFTLMSAALVGCDAQPVPATATAASVVGAPTEIPEPTATATPIPNTSTPTASPEPTDTATPVPSTSTPTATPEPTDTHAGTKHEHADGAEPTTGTKHEHADGNAGAH